MNNTILLLLLFCLDLCNTLQAQDLNISDEAPPLQVSEWIKGKPIQEFEKGHIYVVEFWSTWCYPCIKVMPHLSKLSRKYKNSVTIIGVNILEKKKYPKERAKAIVDSMGRWANYPLVFQDSNLMEKTWFDAAGEQGIPSTFVVNREGKIAWIGYPTALDKVLPKLINNTWDINTALAKRKFENCIDEKDDAARDLLSRYCGNTLDWYGEPDSILFYARKLVSQDPDLKYASNTCYHTVTALLKTDMRAAYNYAKEALQPSNPLGPSITPIILAITNYEKYLDNIPAEIYHLGAEAMNGYATETPKHLNQIAGFYWRGGDKKNAMLFMKKTRKAMKTTKIYGKGHFF